MAIYCGLCTCNSAVKLFCNHHHQYHHLHNFHYHYSWVGFEIFRVVKKLWPFGLLHRVDLYMDSRLAASIFYRYKYGGDRFSRKAS
jgi:hypothetical protein